MKLLILTLILGVPFPIFAENKYQNFSELSKYEAIGVDYRIGIQDVGSKISIFAIHGGLIEPTTTEIAKAIARDEFNYYLFEGIKTDGNWDLHISSSQFDEPHALRLTEKSKTCVSIHGFKEKSKKLVCLGGMNERLKELISRRIKETNILDSYREGRLSAILRKHSGKYCQSLFRLRRSNRIIEGAPRSFKIQLRKNVYFQRSRKGRCA